MTSKSKTIIALAKKHVVNTKELAMGVIVEKEHSGTFKDHVKNALDHLKESGNQKYDSKLKKTGIFED